MRWLSYAVAATAVAVAAPGVAQGNEAKGREGASQHAHAPQAQGESNGNGNANGRGNGAKPRQSSGMMAGPEFAGQGGDVEIGKRAQRAREDYQSGAAWRDKHDNRSQPSKKKDRGDFRRINQSPVLDRMNQARSPARMIKDRMFDDQRVMVPSCPPGLAKKDNGCLPPGLAKARRDPVFGYGYSPNLFGLRVPGKAQYAYRDGYLLPIGDAGGGYIPLLGGALAVGQVWPQSYPSYQLPQYVGDYFGVGDRDRYRYADDVVYRVNPQTAAIEAVAALLTGSTFEVGSPLPPGYDVYNLPRPYRDRYVDSSDALYRYADGRIYQVDPTTMLIAKAIDLVL